MAVHHQHVASLPELAPYVDEQPRIDAEKAIQEACVPSQFPAPEIAQPASNSTKPEDRAARRLPGEWS